MHPEARTPLRHWCVFLLTFVALAHPRHASADSPSEEASMEQRRADAKAKYQQGADAYSAGRYKDAVDAFLAADRLASSAPLSFNIARAYERLADDAGALRWYRDYLRRNPAATNGEQVRSQIATLAESLRKKGVQQLTVLTSPAGATVTIDDQPLGITPFTGELRPGSHHLLLSQRGYADVEREFVLVPEKPQDLSVRLEQLSLGAIPTTAAPLTATPERSAPAAAAGKKLGVLPWVTLGAGALSLGGAFSFELLRRSAESEAKREVTQIGYQDRFQTEHSRQVTARVLLAVGGTLAAAGGLMLLLDTGNAAPLSANLLCFPGLCGVSARGRF